MRTDRAGNVKQLFYKNFIFKINTQFFIEMQKLFKSSILWLRANREKFNKYIAQHLMWDYIRIFYSRAKCFTSEKLICIYDLILFILTMEVSAAVEILKNFFDKSKKRCLRNIISKNEPPLGFKVYFFKFKICCFIDFTIKSTVA